MTEAEEQALRAKMAELEQEHRDLDTAIQAMADMTTTAASVSCRGSPEATTPP